MAFFWQVFFSDRKVSQHRRPSSLRAAADLADDHRVADILLRAVGVERHLGALGGDQQFAFAPLEAGKRRIEAGKAGGAAEQAVEPSLQTGLGLGRRIGAIELR